MLAGLYDNPMPIWFLAILAGFKLPTEDCCIIALAVLELTAVVEGFMTQ
jgi:hypothetical protein